MVRVRGSMARLEAVGVSVAEPDPTAQASATAGHEAARRAVRPDPRVPRDRACSAMDHVPVPTPFLVWRTPGSVD